MASPATGAEAPKLNPPPALLSFDGAGAFASSAGFGAAAAPKENPAVLIRIKTKMDERSDSIVVNNTGTIERTYQLQVRGLLYQLK